MTMPRLIDADALDDLLDEIEGLKAHAAFTEGIMVARRELANAPTIDAKLVLQCNMCNHYETDTGWCEHHLHSMDWDGFCSCGVTIIKEKVNHD